MSISSRVRRVFSPALPAGLSVSGAAHQARVQMLADLTFMHEGKQVSEQMIFDAIEQIIADAQEFLVLDMFLFNPDHPQERDYPKLSARITKLLIERKQASPQLPILLITDPMNTFYGAYSRDYFERMRGVGIEVVETNLDALPDSNPAYSLLYRSALAKVPARAQVLPNVLDPQGPKVSAHAYAQLLNFKANHRKVALNESQAVVSSANPHDASAPNANFGFRVSGAVVADLFESERAVYAFSAPNGTFFNGLSVPTDTEVQTGEDTAALLTEGAIRTGVLDLIRSARPGDSLAIGMFYFSERSIIDALKNSARKGVLVQAILDKNKDAFGRSKTGLPNLPVSAELADAGVQIRWAATSGEQYHPKFIARLTAKTVEIIAGSGNFTRRNVGDFNLETSLRVRSTRPEFMAEFTGYWSRQWDNRDAIFTQSLEEYKKPKAWQHAIYRLQEATGLSTF